MNSFRMALVTALFCAFLVSSGSAVDPVKPKAKVTNWVILWDNASKQSRETKKPILAYFCGSDWEPFTQQLQKDGVTDSDMFRDWAAKNVILFLVDFPKEAKQSANIKTQNDQLKQRYGINKVPTFILMDFSGAAFDRAYYDQAKLQPNEAKGEPRAFLAYLEQKIKNKPPDEALVKQPDLKTAIEYGKKHYLSTVMLINHDQTPRTMSIKDDLTHSQEFVKFLNRNVGYVEIQWPFDSDTSPNAVEFRALADKEALNKDAPLQLCVYDMQTKKINFKLTALNPSRVDRIIAMIEDHLPKADYNGGWIDDYHKATSIAHQQHRYIFICYTQMDQVDPNFSEKMFTEIFKTPEFIKYARKKLVMVQADYPLDPAKAAAQAPGLVAQNKTLADLYNIRGYPSVIVLNPKGQKIGDAKYMKGGPEAFIKNLDADIKNDEEREAFLAGDQ